MRATKNFGRKKVHFSFRYFRKKKLSWSPKLPHQNNRAPFILLIEHQHNDTLFFSLSLSWRQSNCFLDKYFLDVNRIKYEFLMRNQADLMIKFLLSFFLQPSGRFYPINFKEEAEKILSFFVSFVSYSHKFITYIAREKSNRWIFDFQKAKNSTCTKTNMFYLSALPKSTSTKTEQKENWNQSKQWK